MNDIEDARAAPNVATSFDNYSIFVRHLDNWIKEVADRDAILGQNVVIEKVQNAIRRNAISNSYHYTELAKKYREHNDEALAEHSSTVASVYRSIAEA